MKKRKLDGKLALHTETLVPLTLDSVVGGAGGPTVTSATTILTRISCLQLCASKLGGSQ